MANQTGSKHEDFSHQDLLKTGLKVGVGLVAFVPAMLALTKKAHARIACSITYCTPTGQLCPNWQSSYFDCYDSWTNRYCFTECM